jgi:hypothetical protein
LRDRKMLNWPIFLSFKFFCPLRHDAIPSIKCKDF